MKPNRHAGSNQRNIGRILIVYLGTAWVFIEAINFFIDLYNWDTKLLDIIILLMIFGLPSTAIYAWFYQKMTKKALLFQLLNLVLAATVITYDFVNPDSIRTAEFRLLKFKENQKKLTQSIRSIAILPFENYSGDNDEGHMITGMHAALTGELGRIGAIRVISSRSTMQFEESKKTIQEIASDLEVDGIIEGSVFGIGDSMIIQLELINAFPTEQQLWSKKFDTDMSNALNLYSDVVKSIAEEIKLVLSPEEEVRLTEARLVNPDAYRAYMKSQFLYDLFTPADFTEALQLLELALEYDPNYLNAYVGIAQIWIGRAQMGIASFEEAYPIIKNAEEMALSLEYESEELYFLLGTIRAYEEWNWEAGIMQFEKAIAFNPNFSDARTGYSYLLAIMQKHDEAQFQLERALELDPFNPHIESFYGWNMLYARKYDEAVLHSNKSLALAPKMWVAQDALRQAYYLLGQFDEAIRVTIILYQDQEMHGVVEALELGFKKGGHTGAFYSAAEALVTLSKSSTFVSPESIAEMYAYAYEKDKALDWLEIAYDLHDPELHYLGAVPIYDFLREEPRFKKLIELIGLSREAVGTVSMLE